MSFHAQERPKNRMDRIEETLIATILGLMTVITFANVIARYVFNSNILWALEATVFLFAWLVLLGASYGVKHTLHIGVDVLVKALPKPAQKLMTLAAAACCIGFAAVMLKGAWDFWSPFIGRRAFFEVNDVPMPAFLQFLADWVNEGERYEKMPRFIPYSIMPIAMALLLFRFLEAGWEIVRDKRDLLIAAHEAEELVDEVERSHTGQSGQSGKGA